MDKKYCLNCRKKVLYTIEEKELFSSYKETTVYYNGKVAICNECKKDKVYVSEINNENVRKGNEAFREKLDIIKVKEIKEFFELSSLSCGELDALGCITSMGKRYNEKIFKRNYAI